ncbi:MAG: helix-turn-helix domain-containing protein [Allomuricauda sp.]
MATNGNWFLKPIFTFEEACEYSGLSKSKMYKHTSSGNIPHYKPEGKLIYFLREELDQWLLRNRKATSEEIERQATKMALT